MVPFSTVVLGYVPGLLPGGLVNTAGFSPAVGDVPSPGTTANSASPAAPAEGISKVVFKGAAGKKGFETFFSSPLNIAQIFLH